MLTLTRSGWSPAWSHARPWAQAVRSAHSPRGLDQAGLLGQGNKLVRRNRTTLIRGPAGQGFHPGDRVRADVEERLIVELELVALERRAQTGLEAQVPRGPLVHRLAEELIDASACDLGMVQCRVRLSEQRLGVQAVGRIHGDADARAHHELLAVQRERAPQRLEDPAGHVGGLLRRAQVVQHHRELVASKPGHRGIFFSVRASHAVRLAHAGHHPGGYRLEQLVSHHEAQGVVDALEAVQPQEQESDRGLAPPG